MPQAGDRIGPYALDRLLGRGGFGEVWLGRREGALATTQVAVTQGTAELIDWLRQERKDHLVGFV